MMSQRTDQVVFDVSGPPSEIRNFKGQLVYNKISDEACTVAPNWASMVVIVKEEDVQNLWNAAKNLRLTLSQRKPEESAPLVEDTTEGAAIKSVQDGVASSDEAIYPQPDSPHFETVPAQEAHESMGMKPEEDGNQTDTESKSSPDPENQAEAEIEQIRQLEGVSKAVRGGSIGRPFAMPALDDFRRIREKYPRNMTCAIFGVADPTITRWDQIAKAEEKQSPAEHLIGSDQISSQQPGFTGTPVDIKTTFASIKEQRASLVANVVAAQKRLDEFDKELREELNEMGISVPTTIE
jgi:hypothetical protein